MKHWPKSFSLYTPKQEVHLPYLFIYLQFYKLDWLRAGTEAEDCLDFYTGGGAVAEVTVEFSDLVEHSGGSGDEHW